MSRTSAPTTPKPCRRWLQVSLRTMMVLMLTFGCGFGWFAYKIKRAREQREVVKAIEKLGGYINERTTSGGVAWATVTWLGRLAEEDLASDVTMLALAPFEKLRSGFWGRWNVVEFARIPDAEGILANSTTGKSDSFFSNGA